MINKLFIDPRSKQPLILDSSANKAIAGDTYFPFEGGVIDFYSRTAFSADVIQADNKQLSDNNQSPELRESHDKAFESAQENNGNIYGELGDLPVITQRGHFRRMEILASIDLGEIGSKVAVDFGTGPWGFAAIFPNLRKAGVCIGFDVSKIALTQAKATDNEIAGKTIYATSDGDSISLADNCVDIFFGGEVIEHVRNPALFVQEVARVCKQNALIILTTPNKDALLYKIDKIPFCTGPEHIALMNCQELRGVLDLFCGKTTIQGYEISLRPDIDATLADTALIDELNRRSTHHPELASGLVAVGHIDKDKYATNARSLTLNEHLWDSEKFGKLPGQVLGLFDDIKGISLEEGFSFRIHVASRFPTLLFWGHDWSGHVEISSVSDTSHDSWLYDLYLPLGGFYRIDLQLPEDCTAIEVRRTGEKSDRAISSQVIFYKFFEYI